MLVPKPRAPPGDCKDCNSFLLNWDTPVQLIMTLEHCGGRKKGLMWEEKDYLGLYRVQAGSVTFLGIPVCTQLWFFWREGSETCFQTTAETLQLTGLCQVKLIPPCVRRAEENLLSWLPPDIMWKMLSIIASLNLFSIFPVSLKRRFPEWPPGGKENGPTRAASNTAAGVFTDQCADPKR